MNKLVELKDCISGIQNEWGVLTNLDPSNISPKKMRRINQLERSAIVLCNEISAKWPDTQFNCNKIKELMLNLGNSGNKQKDLDQMIELHSGIMHTVKPKHSLFFG